MIGRVEKESCELQAIINLFPYVVENDLQPLICLPAPPECRDYSHASFLVIFLSICLLFPTHIRRSSLMTGMLPNIDTLCNI